MPKRNETLKFSTSFLGSARASATTTIVDTSYPMTYNTRWSTNANGSGTITEVNEGNDAYFIVSSDNVPDGTVLSVMLSSGPSANGITGDDIVNYQYKQNVTIYNNFASLKVSIAADQVTENREEFYGMLLDSNGSNLSHAWLAINDTSKSPAPTYSMGWYSNVSATTAITSINEGSTAWLIINTTNVTNGTKMVVRINGEISESDFVDNGWERSVIIQNNIGRISYPIKADNLTEGVEKINAFLFLANDDFTVKANAALNINDTSLATTVGNAFIFTVGQWYDSANNGYVRGYRAANGTGAIVENNLYIDGIKFNPDQAYGSYLDPITDSINYVAYILTGTPGINFSDDYRFKLTNLNNGNTYYSGNGFDVVVFNNQTLLAADSPEHRDIILANLLIVGNNVKLEIERL